MPTGRTSNKDIPTFGEIQIKGKDIVSNGTAGSAQTIEFAIGSDNTSFDSQEISDFYIDSVVLKQEALKYDLNFVSNETAQNMPSKQTITAGRTVTSEPGEPTRTGYKFSGWKKELSGGTLEANNFTFGQTLTSDTKLVASWKKLHKVEFIQKKLEQKQIFEQNK
ncbi:InlB B-repeat-containing protein [Candidatus Gracilibacteria bacterium]|nr:InlB B-repeat-containing protein [Candidatus Gracilibacteria bacterium]